MGLGQMSLFDGSQEFSIDKPIRLIELFAGYGSQAFALKYLNKNFEHYKICEWAVKSIQAYKDAHFKEDNRDYSQDYSKDQIIDYLYKRNISMDYNEPMTLEEIKRLGETRQRQIFNNIKATNNLVDIQQTSGSDLEIVETDKYCYIMTYSFPCQDLSSAGLGKGMAKGSGTRSGMLWQVERLLDECSGYIPHRHKPKNPRIFSMTPYTDWYNPPDTTKLPQILLMENVPEVVGKANIKHFAKWLEKLETLGYKNYRAFLNARNYGVPQSRDRCFMVSLLGDYYYHFPEPIKLELKLEDLLEDNVDEKFYLSDRAIKGSLTTNFGVSKLENKAPKDGIMPTIMARDYKDPKCIIETPKVNIKGKDYDITKNYDNYIEWHQPGMLDMDTRAWKTDKVAPTLHTTCGKTNILESSNLKRQLCNDLISSGKVKENDFIRHSYSSSRMKEFYISNRINHDCSPTLDTRCDCLGIVEKQDVIGTYQFDKSENFMKGKDRFKPDKNISDTLQTTPKEGVVFADYRIRKLTPRECFRLMGVKDEDFENIAKNQSNASLYHLAGDSIVVNVLMAIFKNMFKEKKL